MRCLKGKTVYKNIVLGEIKIFKKANYTIKDEKIQDTEAELARVAEAKAQANEELQILYEKALKELGEENAEIIKIQQMLLEDDDYQDAIQDKITTEFYNAEYAVSTTGEEFAQLFASMDDEYMKARSIDIKDITGRIVACLCGGGSSSFELKKPVILVADDLTPSETVVMDKSKILGFVTVHGSTNSHTAILARTMNIPALVGVDMNIDEFQSGMEAVVDGYTGEFTVEPDEETRQRALECIEEEAKNKALLQTLKGQEDVTLSGTKINLYANVGSVEDIEYALENDAKGIGLFRSEFLYIGRKKLPDEEEQFLIYKKAAEQMKEKKLIIRTLDIGADKQADYLNLDKEENPALGYRAIRICLTQPEIFKTQLRALYRAAVYGNISIMYPMIISVEEVEQIKKISTEVKEELKAEGVPYKEVEEGIMIETPAAAMISDELAEMVDFFSIGTNDLTQYTLAIDRQNEKLDEFYNARHKGLLKLIQIVADNAHKAGKWVGICGELGADIELTETFIRMGIDELSVAPSMVLKVRQAIRKVQ